MLQCALSWLQVSAGVSYSILERTDTSLPHLESKWIASLRQFLASLDATIQLDHPHVPQLQRERDAYIMDLILESDKFTPAEIRRLNYCRLYLQAITISDLAHATGIDLDLSMRCGSPSLQSSISRWHTIHQERPAASAWSLWRKANLLWSTADGTLLQSLGHWLQSPHHQRRQHFAYQHGRRLFVRITDDKYQEFVTARPSGAYRPRLSDYSIHRFSHLPTLSTPAQVFLDSNDAYWTVLGPVFRMIPTALPRAVRFSTFGQYVQTLQPWETELLEHTRILTSDETFRNHLRTGF